MTIFLAQIWGPVLLAIGLGVFMSRGYYVRVYRDLEQETLAVLTFAIVAIAAGIIQIQNHNVWETVPQIIISFIGWGLLVKGLLFAIVPGFADRAGDRIAGKGLIPVAGAAMLLIGAYLSWFGYIA